MTLRSKFDKGDIVVVYDNKAESKRVLRVSKVASWDESMGFTYAVIEYNSDLTAPLTNLVENYDDYDFVHQLEVQMHFLDPKDYLAYRLEGKI